MPAEENGPNPNSASPTGGTYRRRVANQPAQRSPRIASRQVRVIAFAYRRTQTMPVVPAGAGRSSVRSSVVWHTNGGAREGVWCVKAPRSRRLRQLQYGTRTSVREVAAPREVWNAACVREVLPARRQ